MARREKSFGADAIALGAGRRNPCDFGAAGADASDNLDWACSEIPHDEIFETAKRGLH